VEHAGVNTDPATAALVGVIRKEGLDLGPVGVKSAEVKIAGVKQASVNTKGVNSRTCRREQVILRWRGAATHRTIESRSQPSAAQVAGWREEGGG
jgi:hypothetical protein